MGWASEEQLRRDGEIAEAEDLLLDAGLLEQCEACCGNAQTLLGDIDAYIRQTRATEDRAEALRAAYADPPNPCTCS